MWPGFLFYYLTLPVAYLILRHIHTIYAITKGIAMDTHAMTLSVKRLDELL